MWSENPRDRAILSRLLEPLSVEEFVERYYERSPLYIPRNEAARYDEYFSLEEYERILFGSIVRARDLSLVKDGVAARIDTYAQEVVIDGNKRSKNPVYEMIDPDHVSSQFGQGCSLVLDAVAKMSPPLARLVRDLEKCFRHRVNPNVYMTPPGNQGFAIHYDTHDTIIIQIEGSKHWRVYNSPTELPLEDRFFDKKLHAVGEVQLEMEMRPGDFLYIPRGFLHEGKANEQLSLHVTLGLYPKKWYNVLAEAVLAASEAEPLLRRSVDFEDLTDADFQAVLARVFTDAKLRAGFEKTDREFSRERRNGLDGQMRQIAALPELGESSFVAMRSGMLYELSETEQSTKVAFSGKTLTFGKTAAALVRELEAKSSVSVASLLEKDENALKVVRRMIQEGFAVQLLGGEKEDGSTAVA